MLTAAQLQTLKAAIAADGTLNALPNNPDGNNTIAATFNAASSPALAIWRRDVGNAEVTSAIVASAYIALTALQQKALDLYITPNTIDATSANVRAGFNSIFGAGTTLTNLTAISQRTATRLEALFASGGPPATTAVNVFGYAIGFDEIGLARRS